MKIKIFTIPNIITCFNLLMGCAALISAFRGELKFAFWFIVAGAVFDFLDGLFARLLNQYSPVGKELDSLADMVTFGTVPAVIMWQLLMPVAGANLALLGFLIAPMSALRLAKFNVDQRQTSEFIGLPTPANAMFISSLVFLNFSIPCWVWWLLRYLCRGFWLVRCRCFL